MSDVIGRRHDMSRLAFSPDESGMSGTMSLSLISTLLPDRENFMRSRDLCEEHKK